MRLLLLGLASSVSLALPFGASHAATPMPGLANCPVTLPASNALPRGARLLGSAPKATQLKYVSLTDQSPAQVRPDGDLLAEIETEVDDRNGVRRASTFFDSTANPVSLVCRYGGVGNAGRGTAMLLVPLPARTRGECVVASALRRGGQERPRVTCRRVSR